MLKWLSTYLVRILGVLFALLILLFIIVSIYVAVNKKELLQKATKELSERLGGQVTIEDISVSVLNNFPRLSLQLKNLSIRDSLYENHRHAFFTAGLVFLRLNSFSLLAKRISLNKAEFKSGALYLYTDSTGYSNAYLLKPKKQGQPEEQKREAALNNLSLAKFSVTIDNRLNRKNFSFYIDHLSALLQEDGENKVYAITQKIMVKSLTFNEQNGSFLKDQELKGKYELNFNTATQSLSFNDISVFISDHPFRFTGSFNFHPPESFKLRIKTEGLPYSFAKKILTPSIAHALRLAELSVPLNAEATLDGPLKEGDPLVLVKWTARQTALVTPLLQFDTASFTGSFTNEVIKGEPRKDPNSKVELYGFRGLWNGIVLNADTIRILNLIKPELYARFKSSFALVRLNNMLASSALAFEEGDADLSLLYKGAVVNPDTGNSKISGKLLLRDGKIRYLPFNVGLNNCTGDISINNSDISLDRFSFSTTTHNNIMLTGQAHNTLALLNANPGKLQLTLHLYSPFLNLEGLSALLARSGTTTRENNVKTNRLHQTANRLDNLLESGDVKLTVKADKIKHGKITATNLVAALSLRENFWNLQQVSFSHAGGKVQLRGNIREQGNRQHLLSLNLSLAAIDAQQVFYAFDDFGQKGISYRNLRGSLTAEADLSIPITGKPGLDMKRVKGNFLFSLKKGALIEYQPIEKIKETIFKKRDFSNVRFAELKNKLEIGNGFVKINRMPVETSAISFFVEGIYGFYGNTDLSIQVPLRNLKKRDSTYVLRKTDPGAKGGMSVFLRARSGDDGVLKIGYDPLARFRKTALALPGEKTQ